jgi:outer membrane beta-barrel protein
MRNSLANVFLIVILTTLTSSAFARSTSETLDTLGGNEKLLDMANSMDPGNRSRIVQKRIVDRNYTLEFGGNYGMVAGGDSYLKTQNLGASVDFHINPRVSIGARYYDYGNQLTPEGERVFQQARAAYEAGGRSYAIPDIDYPLHSYMGTLSWYPMYGKTNLLDWGIAQFDLYLIGGYGQIALSSGSTGLAMAGTGMALWMTKHLSARAEVRYQGYKDQIITGPRNINTVSMSVGLGFLL